MEGMGEFCMIAGDSGGVHVNGLLGVSKVDISLPQKLVVVETTAPADEVLEKIRKTGKAASQL
jgi:copper chaperone CopZ